MGVRKCVEMSPVVADDDDDDVDVASVLVGWTRRAAALVMICGEGSRAWGVDAAAGVGSGTAAWAGAAAATGLARDVVWFDDGGGDVAGPARLEPLVG